MQGYIFLLSTWDENLKANGNYPAMFRSVQFRKIIYCSDYYCSLSLLLFSCSLSWVEVFYRFFFTEHQTSLVASLETNLAKPCRSQAATLFPGAQADRWLAVFVRYKRQCWPFQSNISHRCSYAPAVSSWPLVLVPACLIPGPSSCLQLLKTCSCLPALAWLFLATFNLAPFCSARTLVPILSVWFPLLASPALQRPCSRMWYSLCHTPRVCYQPDTFSTSESETNCDLSNFWTHSTIHLSIFCWVQPWAGFAWNAVSACLLGPNYREQQAEILAYISVRAETPGHVY